MEVDNPQTDERSFEKSKIQNNLKNFSYNS